VAPRSVSEVCWSWSCRGSYLLDEGGSRFVRNAASGCCCQSGHLVQQLHVYVYVLRNRNSVCSLLVVNVFSARVREMAGQLGACHSPGLCRRCSGYFARQTVSGSLVPSRGPERKFLVKAARADANCLGLFRIRFGCGQVLSC